MFHRLFRSSQVISRSRRKTKSSANNSRSVKLTLEALEQRQLLSVNPIISEFMADNSTTLVDYYGKSSDWLEIYNPGLTALTISGWKLQDDSTIWTIPKYSGNVDITIPAQGYLKVFCDGRDVVAPTGELHANFKLGASGDYLGLLKPDNTVVSEYSPQYPQQFADVSYGLALEEGGSPIVSSGASAKAFVPTTANGGDTLGATWQGANESTFSDSTWISGTTGIGMPSTVSPIASSNLKLRLNADSSGGIVTDTSGSGYNGTNNGTAWVASTTDTENEPLTRSGLMQFNATENDQVTVASNGVLCNNGNTGMQGAISFWMRSSGTTGTSGDGAVLVSYRSSRGILITQTDAGQIRVRCYQGSTAVNDILSNGTVSNGQWHQITVAFNQNSGSVCAIYIDGEFDNQGSNSANWAITTGNPLEIGRSTASSTPALSLKNYNGLLDDFRYYTAALTPSQIASIAKGADESVKSSDVGLNLQSQMQNVNSSAFIRIPFTIDNPEGINDLLLSVRHNDGFIAWINGVQVAQENSPVSPAWNSAATDVHSPGRAWKGIIDDLTGLLHAGTNILAIQGLNISSSDTSFLIIPQLSSNVTSVYGTEGRYFVTPTPGKINGSGASDLGPIVTNVSTPAIQPAAGTPITVTARVTTTLSPLQSNSVTLHYRVMYNTEIAMQMYDDGLHGDGAAVDGIFGATIPAGTATAGQMLRWYVTATDTLARVGRWPLLMPIIGDDGGPEYEGTVIADPALTSTLPIFQSFIVNPAAADNWSNRTGTRGSVYYLGRFYDNVFVRCRGGYTTNGNKFKFNSGYDFTFAEDQAPVSQINLNQQGWDETYSRPALAFETLSSAGVAASIAFDMRVQRNNQYYRVMYFIEEFDNHLLKREGIYENGAIYKGYTDTMTSASDFRKENRDEVAGTNDLQQFLNGLHLSNPEARRKFIYDNVNIPAMLDYLAATTLFLDNDQAAKNYYIYCDTNDGTNATYGYANPNGTNEWAMAPWDKDLTFGKNYGWADYSTVDPQAHPFFGDSQHPKLDGPYNWMIDVFLDVPELKQMYVRRLRTLMDEFLQPPGTPYGDRYYENRFDELYAKLMGDPVVKGRLGDLVSYFNDIKTRYLDPRRTHLYVDHSLNTSYLDYAGIPAEQADNLIINFGAYEVSPASGNQDQEYLTLINPSSTAIDISGWKLQGGIDYTFSKGVIIPAGGTLYVSPNVYAFRQRTTGPSGNQGLLVQGNYDGRLSMLGEVVQFVDLEDHLISTLTTPANPSLTQQYLRVTELMYHPADPPKGSIYTSDDFQFIELKNTSSSQTLSLSGVRFTDGVTFDFTGSNVTSLAPGERVLVVSNLAAFQSRYGTGLNGIIAGQFAKANLSDASITYLSKSGEKLTLVDSVGETILSFSYQDDWFKQSDGSGNSLVIRDAAAADRSLWGQREGWFASHAANGSPGADETPDYAVDVIVVNEILSHTDITNPGDWVEFYNTTAAPINIGGWYLSDNDSDLKKYQIATGTVIAAHGYITFNHHDHFGNTADPGYETEFSFDEYGGTVYLTSASGEVLTTYQASQKFDDNDRDRDGTYPYHGNTSVTFSFGRYVKSTGGTDFVETTQSTYNTANTAPRVGPVVINEINYNPAAGNASYIELKNLTAAVIDLYDPDHANPLNPSQKNTWRLSGGVDFTFPQGATIPANGYALVVDTDPAWFRTRYSVPASVPIYGSYLHELGNGGDSVELVRPGEPDANPAKPVPYYSVDKVTYEDSGLWPKAADGFRACLNRATATAYGNDVVNWIAGRPTPGTNNATFVANPISLTTPATATPGTVTATTTALSVLADSVYGASSLLYDWSAFSMPAGASYPTFSANDSNAARNTTVTFGNAGTYTFTVRITDLYGASITSSVTVTVVQTLMGITISPSAPMLSVNGQQQFTAVFKDQFDTNFLITPTLTWTATVGTIDANGLYTAPSYFTTATILASSGSITSNPAIVTMGNATPTVATPAAANPSPATGTTANLSVLGADDLGEANLTYTWTTTTMPSGTVQPVFSDNGTNAAKNITVTFGMAGTYKFTVRITDLDGASITSSVTVTVRQTAAEITIQPTAPELPPNGQQQFTALAKDQFGNDFLSTPVLTWTATAGTIDINGLYTAPAHITTITILASSGSVTSNPVTVTMTDGPPTIVTPASANPSTVTGTTTNLSVLGADEVGEADLTYTWTATLTPSDAAQPTYTINGTNAAKNTTATFYKSGLYRMCATVTNSLGLTVTSSFYMTVSQRLTSVVVTPGSVNLPLGGTQQFSAAALDQFGLTMSVGITWSTTAGSITTGGLYTAPTTPFTATVRAVAGSISGTASVNMLNNPPSDIFLSNQLVAENAPGAAIGTLSAVDPNTGDTFTFSLLNDPTAKFEIIGNALKLKNGQSLDFEATPTVGLVIRTTDSGGLSYDKAFTITATDMPETLVLAAADWNAASSSSATLKLVDGKLHVYKSGTTTDIVPPHFLASVTGIDVTGRNLSDLLIVDSMGAGVPYLAIHNATMTISQDNAISSDTNVSIDASILDFYGLSDSFGNLIVTNNGHATLRAINNATTTVESGTLTATSIVCDTLTIGTVAGTAASMTTPNITNGEAMFATEVPQSIENDLLVSATADNAPLVPALIDSPTTFELPRIDQAIEVSRIETSATLVAVTIDIPQVNHSAISAVIQDISTPEITMSVRSPEQTSHRNINPIIGESLLLEHFIGKYISNLDQATRFDCQYADSFTNPFLLTEHHKKSVYDELANSLTGINIQPSFASPRNQSVHSLALQLLAREYEQNNAIEPYDYELLIGKHFNNRDNLAQKTIDKLYTDLMITIE